jgi:hypothetical protein
MPPALFAATTQFRSEHSTLYEFVHGATAAMWNTRWHVGGYLAAVPDASTNDLQSRFVLGSGIHGVNVRRTFVEQSWSAQTEELAQITLINTVALYEAWAESVVKPFGGKSLAKDLQFPSRGHLGRKSRGIGDALRDMTKNKSMSLDAEFAPALRKQRAFRDKKLDELLTVYRYFKELRNSAVHGGGLATNAIVKAYGDLHGLTAASIGMKEFPEHHPPIVGSRTQISLRGVIGFGAVVYSIVTTVDGLLASTSEAEDVFVDRVRSSYNGATLPSTEPKRSRRVRSIIEKSGLPGPASVDLLSETLKARGVII